MILYKLTDQNNKTRSGESNETVWAVGVIHTVSGNGKQLCSPDVIHAYRDPLLAVLFNPRHFNNPKLWEAEGEIVAETADKCGVKSLTILRELPLPELSIESRVRFAIAVALDVYTGASFIKWAKDWLSGKDRSSKSAARAYAARSSAARAAIYAVTTATLSVNRLIQLAKWAITDLVEIPEKVK